MANETEKSIAQAVLLAVKLREESYDRASSNAATVAAREQPFLIIDYSKYYRLSLEEACNQAAAVGPGAALGRILYLALDGWWNDTIDWANDVLEEQG